MPAALATRLPNSPRGALACSTDYSTPGRRLRPRGLGSEGGTKARAKWPDDKGNVIPLRCQGFREDGREEEEGRGARAELG